MYFGSDAVKNDCLLKENYEIVKDLTHLLVLLFVLEII